MIITNMKNILKYGLFLALPLFMACSEDGVDYVPAEPMGQHNVGIDNHASIVVGMTDTEFPISLSRESGDGELTVPIVTLPGNMFEVPASATFAAGSTTTQIIAKVPADMELNTPYKLSIRLDEAYSNFYKDQESSYELTTSVIKEDYAVYDIAKYSDGWSEEEWEVKVEYSTILDLYRIKSVYKEGINLYFKWNKETDAVTVTDSAGSALANWVTGIVLPDYGSVYVTSAGSKYLADNNAVGLNFTWRVSAGSFGASPSYIYFSK